MLMSPLTVLNAIANTALAISAIGLLIHIFGDPTNPIWDNKVKAWLAKIGLSTTICGAVSNILTLSTPANTEVILNCGISFTFFWLSWWQYEQFRVKVEELKRPTRRKRKPKPKTLK